MNDDSRMLLQWVGPYFDIIIQNSVRNNTQAVLRQSTRLFTLGIHHAYACAIINRWGRGLSDAPGGPEKSSPSKRKKAKRDAKEQKSPGFSSLQHSFLNPAIGASFYPGLNANHGRQNAGSSMDKVSSSTHARGPTRPVPVRQSPRKGAEWMRHGISCFNGNSPRLISLLNKRLPPGSEWSVWRRLVRLKRPDGLRMGCMPCRSTRNLHCFIFLS
ncbi:hypothetical protein B0H13DRAFT_350602 [Mycena leptocephala]|nr:hypothetical protein B0H13DRAFT_350602 [Mycena leptocephala]